MLLKIKQVAMELGVAAKTSSAYAEVLVNKTVKLSSLPTRLTREIVSTFCVDSTLVRRGEEMAMDVCLSGESAAAIQSALGLSMFGAPLAKRASRLDPRLPRSAVNASLVPQHRSEFLLGAIPRVPSFGYPSMPVRVANGDPHSRPCHAAIIRRSAKDIMLLTNGEWASL